MESTFQPKTNVQPIITQAPRIVRARRCVSLTEPPSGQTGPRNEKAAPRRLRGPSPTRLQARPQAAAGRATPKTAKPPQAGKQAPETRKPPRGRLQRGPACAEKRGSPRSGQRRPILPRASPSVLSAMEGLTAGFGMGPGVPPPPWPLTRPGAPANRLSRAGTLAASIARKTSVDP